MGICRKTNKGAALICGTLDIYTLSHLLGFIKNFLSV